MGLMLFADDLMTMNQLLAMLIAVSVLVLCICVFGYIKFVRWGQKETEKNRQRDIEMALIEREREEAADKEIG